MTLKAQCIDGTIVDIKITDCPVRISKELAVLAALPMSKLIYDCSIKRCEDKYVEYSYVFDESYKLIGYLIYKSGWKVCSTDTNEFFDLKDEYTFTPNQNIKLIGKLHTLSDPITFTVNDHKYGIRSIIGKYEGKFILNISGRIRYIDIGSESEVTIQ